jgi:hypothetical protein
MVSIWRDGCLYNPAKGRAIMKGINGDSKESTKDAVVVDVINEALKEHPDVQLVLAVAARARETEARELPREIGVATEVAAITTNLQTTV